MARIAPDLLLKDVDNDQVLKQPALKLSGNGLPGGEQQTIPHVTPASDTDEGSSNKVSPSDLISSASTELQVPVDENNHKYVGLVNQAMTCYLNSLIQSLYMTPEFRNAMYNWEYTSSTCQNKAHPVNKKGELSIPCQLQKLFLLLQTTESDSLETRDLTASFGWSASEAYDQHDVQELCRLMFDALDHKWKGTKHEKLIQDLYRGTMEDFVRCLNCGKESTRIDYFLDLPLAVKPFGASQAYKSVEEALDAFVQPELLNGSNQYMCEKCKSKQDAHKGLRITQFPYLLTIQLKRFDFDYNTMHRIKLNDKMTFPDVLDLNDYIMRNKRSNNESEVGETAKNTEQPNIDCSNKNVLHSEKNPYKRSDVQVGQKISKTDVKDLIKKNGENVYELFSVMVHSGNAAGGHYYAYIKNMEQDKWYVFNDTRVDVASSQEIEKSFGGNQTGWNTLNTNAYMLMYRKIDTKNVKFMHTPELPPHIKKLQLRWKQLEKEAEEDRLQAKSLLTAHVTLNYPFPSVVKKREGSFEDLTLCKHQLVDDFVDYVTEISREHPISMVFNQAYDFFQERCNHYGLSLTKTATRLIYYEKKTMLKIFQSKADKEKKIKSVFLDNQSCEPCPLAPIRFILDCRFSSYSFPVEPFHGTTIKIQRVDVSKRFIARDFLLYIPPNEKVVQARKMISSMFRDDIHEAFASRMVLECTSAVNEFVLIDEKMNGYVFKDVIDQYVGSLIPTVYYDGGLKEMCFPDAKSITEADRKLPFETSRMFQILDRKYFSLSMRVKFPSKEEIVKAVSGAGTYDGPRWADTAESRTKEPKFDALIDTALNSNEYHNCLGTQNDVDSGRQSPSSACLINTNHHTPDCLPSGSPFNNTPQVSPSVSDGGDYDTGPESIDIKNKLNSERVLEYMENRNYHSVETNYIDSKFSKLTYDTEVNNKWKPAFAKDSDLSTSGVSTVSVLNAGKNENSFDILENDNIIVLSTNESWQKLDIDSRLNVGDLKVWIASQMNVGKDQFVLMKHASENESDIGYESHANDNDNIRTAFQSCMISIKLRPPLQHDERMITVVQFDTQEMNREKWRTLFEVPASPKTCIGDVLLHILRLYREIYGSDYAPQQVRLREMLVATSSGNHVLNPNDLMETRPCFSSVIFLQIISDPSLIGKIGQPIFVRRFRPADVEYDSIREIIVDFNSENPVLSFVEQISKYSQIPKERLAVTEVATYTWMKWPFMKSRLDMLDGKVTFAKDLHLNSIASQDFLHGVGMRVLCYKDIEEKPKELSDDERKQIKIKENGQSAIANRRKERPLRIQMSSVSEP